MISAPACQWHVEAERCGKIAAEHGTLDIDVPAGATIWFKPELRGHIAITFDVTALDAGGKNDRVSDVNCFWMAPSIGAMASGCSSTRIRSPTSTAGLPSEPCIATYVSRRFHRVPWSCRVICPALEGLRGKRARNPVRFISRAEGAT